MPDPNLPRRYDCPNPDYPSAYIVLPLGEWAGKHWLRRDAAVESAKRYNHPDFTRIMITLALADDFVLPRVGDPVDLDLEIVPVPVLLWLLRDVYPDLAVSFAKAFEVPKAPSPPSSPL